MVVRNNHSTPYEGVSMKQLFFLLTGTVLLLTVVTGIFGEEETASEDPVFTFVVTASRVEEDILSSSAHVTVITADDIVESGETSIVRLLDKVAGLQFNGALGESQGQVSMRGFGENAHGRVLVMVDGRKLNNPDMEGINWLGISLSDIERIEVLRGPASVLYGNHAVGGVINIITKKPSRNASVSASASVGSFQENQERVSVSLGGKASGVSASVEHFSTEGYRERSFHRTLNASLKGFLDVSETLTFSLGGRYAWMFYQMPGGLTEEEFTANPKQALNLEDEATDHVFSTDADLTWYAGDLLMVDIPLSYEYKNIGVDMASWGSYTDRIINTFSARPQGVYENSMGLFPLRITGGLDAYTAFYEVNQYSDQERTGKTNEYTLIQYSLGPYLTGSVDITDSLGIDGGVRYDFSYLTAQQIFGGTAEGDGWQNALVFDGGVVFRPTRITKLFARGGRLFRYPFIDEQVQLTGFGLQGYIEDLTPEKGFNLEGGFSIEGRSGRIDVSGYFMQLKDEIAWWTDPDAGSPDETSRNINLDKTRRIGSDLEVTFSPVDFLEMTGTYSYVLATYIDGANKGKRIPLVSDHAADGGINVSLPFGLSFGPSVSFRSSAFRGGDNANEQDPIDSCYVLNASARFVAERVPGNLVITAEIKNLLDTSYAPYIYYNSYYPAAGRSFKIGASYSY
jgi:iron complex outermembrane recepter protein